MEGFFSPPRGFVTLVSANLFAPPGAPWITRSLPAVKLALVTETYLPEVNGVAMTLDRLAAGLVQRGHQVEVIRPRQAAEDERAAPAFCGANGVSHWLVPGMPIPMYKSLRLGLPVAPSLARHWKLQPPNVVHVATEGPLGLAALYAAKRFALPVSSSFHTNFHQYGGHYGFRAGQDVALRYLRWFHNRTRCTLVPTEQMQAELQRSGFERLAILARGVDTALFSPTRRSVELRRGWGAEDADPVVIYVGRIAAEKNLRLAVQAFLAMQAVEPRARFVLVGDGPEAAALRQEYPQFHYAGVRRGEDLAAHYASADAFVFPSVTETFGNVITEGLASGLVVLSYDYAAARQYLRDGENGFVAEFNHPDAFVRQARRVMEQRPCWEAVRLAARATTQTITWDAIIGRYEAELVRLCG